MCNVFCKPEHYLVTWICLFVCRLVINLYTHPDSSERLRIGLILRSTPVTTASRNTVEGTIWVLWRLLLLQMAERLVRMQ